MRVRVRPGGAIGGATTVPGDKSIAHRWLILASTASGRSEVKGLPTSLDVLATARCLSRLVGRARPSLEAWASKDRDGQQHQGFTWDPDSRSSGRSTLEVEADGRRALSDANGPLDCANSATTMRLLAGVVASRGFATTLMGDESLRWRPMERVARPLRAMGADVRTTDGHAPLEIRGGPLRGIAETLEVPSAQVKGCLLFAGLAAAGRTTIVEPAPTRDHTERALAALGAPIEIEGRAVRVRAFQHDGFAASVPGDVSSAAFLIGAAALTGAELEVRGVGLNPSRTRFLDVLARMGVETEGRVLGEELGEPVGEILVRSPARLAGTVVETGELPLVIDEVPILALVAAHATGESRFRGAGELRVKESDRLGGLAAGIRSLGGAAAVEGDDLVVGGGGLEGGAADPSADHRMAMAFAVGALAARGESEIEGMEAADVSFPGFVPALARLGGRIEA